MISLLPILLLISATMSAAQPVFPPLTTQPSLTDADNEWLRVNADWNRHCHENKRTWVNWTPEEDRRYAGIIARRILIDFWGDYQLTGEQGKAVQRMLDGFVEQQCAYLKRVRPALQAPQMAFQKSRERQKSGNALPRESLEANRQQLLGYMKGMPSSHRRTIEAQAEALLPPGQVAEGRKRALERRRRRVMPVINDAITQRVHDDKGWRPALDDLRQAGDWPLGDWEAYVELFIRCYALLPDQQGSARSALREALQRRRVIEERRATASASPTTNPSARFEERYQATSALFEELMRTLDKIPTQAQRAQARPGIPTSQSQPS